MRIKRYRAENMQQALEKIKEDLGQDAVILHTKKIKKGGILGLFSKSLVEVTAASEYKENVTKPSNSMDSLSDIRENIDDIKKVIEGISKTNNELNTKIRPVGTLDKAKNFLMDKDVDPQIIEELLTEVSDRLTGKQLKEYSLVIRELEKIIEEKLDLPMTSEETRNRRPKIQAFIGPTGVGKTTTIAKLAASYTLYENKDIALLTTDVYRIAAVDQLKTYAEIIEMPIQVIYSMKDMKKHIELFKDRDYILIDTAGISPRNRIQINELKTLLNIAKPQDVYLVLSATTKEKDIKKIINNYQIFNPTKIIFTKLDETTTYGFILNVINSFNYCVSYVTFGQDVPDDIEKSNPKKLAKLILGENLYGRSG